MIENSISTKTIRRLLISHNIFSAGRVFFEIFLNIFIWKLTEDLTLVAWFNIIYLLLHTLTFHLFADIVKKGKVHLPRIIALLGFALTYLVIAVMGDSAINYVLPIAAVIGFFNGMYWISYQILRFDLTSRENRGNYTGFEKGTKMLVDIVMPALGGAIIVANFFHVGYSNLFLFGSVFFLVSLFIGNVGFPVHTASQFNLRETFSILRKDKDIMKSMCGHALSSFSRGGTIVRLVIPLLIFSVVQNELQLGGWLSFFSAVAILGSFVFGKSVGYRRYKNLLFSGGLGYFALVILVLLFPLYWIYILFGALVKIISVAIDIPKRVISENLIHSLENENSHRIEYIVIREWFNIGLGRLSSFVILLTVPVLEVSQMKILLLLVALAVLIEAVLLRSIKETLWH